MARHIFLAILFLVIFTHLVMAAPVSIDDREAPASEDDIPAGVPEKAPLNWTPNYVYDLGDGHHKAVYNNAPTTVFYKELDARTMLTVDYCTAEGCHVCREVSEPGIYPISKNGIEASRTYYMKEVTYCNLEAASSMKFGEHSTELYLSGNGTGGILQDHYFDEDNDVRADHPHMTASVESYVLDLIDGGGEFPCEMWDLAALADKNIVNVTICRGVYYGSNDPIETWYGGDIYGAIYSNQTWTPWTLDNMCGQGTYCSDFETQGFLGTLLFTEAWGADANQYAYCTSHENLTTAMQHSIDGDVYNWTLCFNKTVDTVDYIIGSSSEYTGPNVAHTNMTVYYDDGCTPSWQNTSWTYMGNTTKVTTLEDCNVSDQRLNWTVWTEWNYTVEWDVNECPASTNTTHYVNTTWYDNETLSCDYCQYNITNTSVSGPFDINHTFINGSCNVSGFLDYQIWNWSTWSWWTQYDTNATTCYGVTGLESDNWTNITWYENVTNASGNYTYNVPCEGGACTPDWYEINDTWTYEGNTTASSWYNITACNVSNQTLQERYFVEWNHTTGWFNDTNSCGEEAPANNTYYVNTTWYEHQVVNCTYSPGPWTPGASVAVIYDILEQLMIRAAIFFTGDVYVGGDLEVGGCIKHSCADPGGCVTIGECLT